MISEKFEWRILLRIVLLSVTLSAASFFAVKGWWTWFIFVIPVIIWQLTEFYRSQIRIRRELNRFAEAVQYKDFTGNFPVRNVSSDLSILRNGFNAINNTFRRISKEKETQHQYLQNILELVNTGIISFEKESGEVVWMNESLKRMLDLPYLKTIHALERRDAALYRDTLSLKPGESKVGVMHNGKRSFKVLLSATFFQTDGKKYALIAFQNINEAIDETESKAWQKLLSVLTHEIMNSIAPISSLAETVTNRLKTIDKTDNNGSALDDLELGISTIKRRSEGLLKFSETYRSLNKVSVNDLQKIYARDLFENLYTLMQPGLDEKNIELEIILKDPDLFFEADVSLIEQVLINLVINAIEAVKDSDDPQIIISAFRENNGKTVIKVSDNGNGIPEDLLDKIFIPFFSTKKTGSGIGLTLCKQIMMLHHGNIEVQTIPGTGTHFMLTL